MDGARGATGKADGDMATEPVFDPNENYLVNVSGGRSSAFMLHVILEGCAGRLPENARAVFTNTGKEREETLRFVREISQRWRVPITWLEFQYRAHAAGGRNDPKYWWRVVDYESASREGEPFEQVIRAKKMLPHVQQRICTSTLKVEPVQRWARATLGWARPWSVLGIRHDEPRRWKRALFAECRTVYPLVERRIDAGDVRRFWAAQPFDLRLRDHEGNCDLCFLKSRSKLLSIMRQQPERAEWWKRMEAIRLKLSRVNRDRTMSQFRKTESYADLQRLAMDSPTLPLGDAGDGDVDCFCGD